VSKADVSGRRSATHALHLRGSITVELLALTPVVVAFLVVALGFGRYELALEQVQSSARVGAEAAAVAPSLGQAQSAAISAVAPGLLPRRPCDERNVAVDTRGFAPGGTVIVSVTCRVSFSDLGIPVFPGSLTVRARQAAPIDPYRAVQP